MTPEQQAAIQAAQQRLIVQAAQERAKPDRTFLQTVADNLLGDDDPNTQNFGERVGSALNKAGESMTFGLVGDEASAAVESLVPGVDYEDRRDHYRQQEAVLERDNPGLALTADIGGALAMPIGGMGAMKAGTSLAKRMAASGAVTGGLSGVYGFMEGEGGAENRISDAQHDAATGAVIGAMLPIIGSGVQRVVNKGAQRRAISKATKAARASGDHFDEAKRAYDAVDAADVQIKPQAFDRLRADMTRRMEASGLDNLPGPGSLTPKGARVQRIGDNMASEMAQHPTAALPFGSLEKLRRHAGQAAADVNMGKATPDAKVGTNAIGAIDDFVEGMTGSDIVSGDLPSLQSAIAKARASYAQASRTRTIEDAIEAGLNNYQSGEASGLANQFRRILNTPKLARGFSDAEKAVMRKVVTGGSIPEQMLRYMGSGLGMMGQMGAAGVVGGLPGALAGAATAAGSRALANRNAVKNADLARQLIAGGRLQNLPKPSEKISRIVEQLLRQGTVAVPQ